MHMGYFAGYGLLGELSAHAIIIIIIIITFVILILSILKFESYKNFLQLCIKSQIKKQCLVFGYVQSNGSFNSESSSLFTFKI